MIIKSIGEKSILKNHLHYSEIVFGKDSNAVRYLEDQVELYGENHPIKIEEQQYFVFLKDMNR